ncbi:hypothetical protein MMC08_000966 [Hypocenomyce scalaris]|nr:hypothetical protein [Hypocenomyce scalaris]
MSYSPATPDKSTKAFSKEASKVAVPSIDKLTSSAKGKEASLHEPSPASTYGDTAAGDSVPATPIEAGDHDGTTALMQSLRAAQIHDSDEPTGESPAVSRQAKRYAHSERPADTTRVNVVKDSSSPSKTGGIGNIAGNTVSAGSSPSARRHQDILASPSWRRAGFVHQHGQAEDPFTTSSIASQTAVQQGGDNFLPREDRVNLELSGDTAQALLPPNACVFVANLTASRSDDQLEHSVTRAFSEFGTVYVKIRRDNHGMPFAFCQYEHVADSQNAIDLGRGILIDGRPCRTERAKVNRSLYLSRVRGGPISEREAHSILRPYGAIEKTWVTTPTDREMFRLPEGIWVTFAFFQDCRDAQAVFRDDRHYRLEQPVVPGDMPRRINRPVLPSSSWTVLSPVARPSPNRPSSSSPSRFVKRARDRCTIFVGGLPPHVSQNRLEALFTPYGLVRNCELISKTSATTQAISVFAFVEFASEAQATAAVLNEHAFDGVNLRVEHKDSSERRVSPGASSGSPHANFGGYGQNDPRYSVYSHALAVGFDPVTAAPILALGQGSPLAPPVYTPYSFYGSPYQYAQSYGTPANATSASPGMHGNAQNIAQQPMGHFQYSQGQGPYLPYQPYPPPTFAYQQHSMVNSTAPSADNAGTATDNEETH